VFKNRTKILLIFLLPFLVFPILARAQTTAQVTLGLIDLNQFPKISTFMDVRDSQGYFQSGLGQEDVVIFEDGAQLQAAEVTEQRIGAQFVVALNLGTALNIEDDQGLKRIDYISQALISWIGSTDGQSPDTYNLLSTEGIILNHTDNGEEWAATLQEYQPELAVLPTLDVLSRALDVVSDPVPNIGMGRAVIFITPALPLGNQDIIQSLADRARQNGIRIFIGLVDSSAYFNQEEASQLQSLAIQTGGQFFAFSGTEPLPDLNTMVESSRRIYHLAYNSQIAMGGEHDIEVLVQTPVGDFRSGFEEFSLDLLPPNPFFLSPPSIITRSIPEGQDIEPQNLVPVEEQIQILIEFPDNIDREIVRTVLYANNEFLVENISPPFTEFVVNLTPYEASQQILLRVEAFDELGLFGSSVDHPINITVIYPEQTLWKVLSDNISVFAIGISLFAGTLLLLILILSGRIKPGEFGEKLQKQKINQDPLTQPILGSESTAQKKSFIDRFRLKKPAESEAFSKAQFLGRSKPVAFLEKFADGDEPANGIRHDIGSKETIIGSSGDRSLIRIDNPAVEEQHARLWKDEKGEFWIKDMNSVAGTWVNFLQIGEEPSQIFHGDIIHIADIRFRFVLADAPETPQPEIVWTGEKE
jgi:pSer/pThr/pTyr-binding forkhead associated (FHA) protein